MADEVAATPVTFEPLETDPMPAELSDSLTETLYYETLNAPRTAIPRLKKLIGKFPRVPTLKNYLMTAYQLLGKHREHLRTAEAIVAEHPDYPFGRAGLATLRIEQGRVEEARELLGPSLRLRDLCPDRELFHVSEIGVYYAAAGVLRIAEGDLDGAQGVVEGLKRVDPERESIRMLQERLMLARIEHFQERMRRDKENEIRIEGPPVPKAVPVPSQPKPHQEELMALYEHDSDLPEESIRAILALPRESLIADLEGMLDRAVERAGGFLAEFDEDAAPYFPLHALLFLGELESWGSTDRVLRFLNENDELYQFWFSGESGWMFLFPFVKADPERFRQWMLEPDRPGYARSEISEAVAQMALHHPERREEAARWIESVLARLLEAKTGERLLDTHVVTNLVWDAATIRATNAEPLIREAYKRNLVSIQMIGNEPEVLADLHKSTPGPAKPRPGLLAFYRKMGEERQPADDEPEKDEAVETQAREAGRNDPCPCGSGKKFKKCCMK